MVKALMLQGTGSDVGKSVLVAGLCRAALRRGIRVAPFKPQNMSNNAAVADAGADGLSGEIGRAQWLQALACGLPPSVHMNPVLLKPQSPTGAQVVMQGKVWRSASARDYQAMKAGLMAAVLESFARLGESADLILVEGAGSPAEINLRSGDIANMGFAHTAGVPVVLVGDIDRGGVIASLVGTHAVLDDRDRGRIVGYLINKFRGDSSLFEDGVAAIGRFTGWRCFGVLPWVEAVRRLPAEDSVALDQLARGAGHGGKPKIIVPAMGRIANFDDIDPLRAEAGVEVIFVRHGERLPADAALVILPGSKSTIADLQEFRANGWEEDLRALVAAGTRVIGLCGGYQMLGKTIRDPDGVEGDVGEIVGLGLLDIDTVLEPEKITRNAGAVLASDNTPLGGYEIHMGRSEGPGTARPMIRIDGRDDGAVSADSRIMGCYLHGLFGSGAYRRNLLASLGATSEGKSHLEAIESALDELAREIEGHLDVDGLLAAALPVLHEGASHSD